MLAVSYVYESVEGHLCKHNAFFSTSKDFIIDEMNFDDLSCLEWIKNLQKSNVEDYVFVGGGRRLEDFVAFLNANTPISFYILNHLHYSPEGVILERLSKWLHQPKSILNQLHKQYRHKYLEKLEGQMFNFITGYYDESVHNKTIYSIYLSDGELLSEISPSVYLHLAINATIFVKGDTQNLTAAFITRTWPTDFIEANLVFLEETKAKSVYYNFVEKGKLPLSLKRGIIDASSIFSRDHLQRLVVDTNGIYLDFLKQKPLTGNVSMHYESLRKKAKAYMQETSEFIYWDTLCSVLRFSGRWRAEMDSQFYLLDESKNESKPFAHFVGIECGFEYLLLNTKKNKAFSVTKSFLKEFSKFPESSNFQHMILLLKDKFA